MRKPHLTYNLYWKKYLNYGKHSVIAEYMDKNGLDVYKNVVSINKTLGKLDIITIDLENY